MTERNIGWPMIYGYIAGWCAVGFGLFVLMTRNTAPHAPELEFKEPSPKTNDSIVVKIKSEGEGHEGHDVDGDPLYYRYQWKRTGAVVAEVTADTVPPELTKKGEEWEVTVTPDDGTMGGALCFLPWRECAGAQKGVAKVTVANTPPKAAITFDKPEPKPSETVTANVAASDPDEGDVPTFTYAWLAPGEQLTEGVTPKHTTNVLPGGTARSGQAWTLVVNATDGADAGTPITAVVTFQ